MTKTTKVLIGLLVVALVAGTAFYFAGDKMQGFIFRKSDVKQIMAPKKIQPIVTDKELIGGKFILPLSPPFSGPYSGSVSTADKFINKAEYAKLLVMGAGFTLVDYNAECGQFSDISGEEWYADYVCSAVKNGIMNGYSDGTFGSGNFLTRAEGAKMLVEAFDIPICNTSCDSCRVSPIYYQDLQIGAWYYEYVTTLAGWGISGDVGYWFDPSIVLTENAAQTWVSKAMNL
ncbi:MAG: S-layer homology domain-containing protein [Candidatus Peregrinibacteria bacterium]